MPLARVKAIWPAEVPARSARIPSPASTPASFPPSVAVILWVGYRVHEMTRPRVAGVEPEASPRRARPGRSAGARWRSTPATRARDVTHLMDSIFFKTRGPGAGRLGGSGYRFGDISRSFRVFRGFRVGNLVGARMMNGTSVARASLPLTPDPRRTTIPVPASSVRDLSRQWTGRLAHYR